MKTKKIKRCIKCGTKTTCDGGVCALCKAGITQIHDELVDLLRKN